MLNPGLKCWKNWLISLMSASAIAVAGAVDARPITVEDYPYLGPVPYRGPTITHMPMRSIGSISRRYYTPRGYSSYPSYSRIRRSTLINPTVIDSQISDSVLINPVIVSPSRQRYYHRGGYLRYVSPGGGVQIQIGHE